MLRWASVGKTFTAAAIMQLAEEGAPSRDDPVSRFVSGVPNGEVATIRDLLAHTAGLPNLQAVAAQMNARRPETIARELALLDEAGALHCPGARFAYSKSGYAILGRIIEQVTDRPWRDVVARRKITKAGLDRPAIIDPEDASVLVRRCPNKAIRCRSKHRARRRRSQAPRATWRASGGNLSAARWLRTPVSISCSSGSTPFPTATIITASVSNSSISILRGVVLLSWASRRDAGDQHGGNLFAKGRYRRGRRSQRQRPRRRDLRAIAARR